MNKKVQTAFAHNKSVPFSTIKVCLDGPFVVVLQKDPANASCVNEVTAFVPKDPMPEHGTGSSQDSHPRHELWFKPLGGNSPLGKDDGKTQFVFQLERTGLELCTATRWVDTGFQDFNLVTDLWHKPDCVDCFVTIKLPCPDRILHSTTAVPVVFASGQTGHLPMHHILEYQVAHPNSGIVVSGEETVSLPAGANSFQFQVGLPLGTTASTVNAHALDFYNNVILSRFPKLADRTLRYIGDIPTKPIYAIDVECKHSGAIVSFPA